MSDTDDDGRHYEHPRTRNSTNPLNLPLSSSRPTFKQATKYPSRSISAHLPTHQTQGSPSNTRSPSRIFSHRASTFTFAPPSSRPSKLTFSSPSYSLSRNPSIFSSNSTSQRPSIGSKRCQSLEGDFGTFTSNVFTVTYNYMMELSLSQATPLIILPSLEIALSDILVASFITRCNMSDIPDGYTNTSLSHQPFLGISSSPADMVKSNSCGAARTSKSINCYILQGRLTLYLPTVQGRRQALNSMADAMTQTSVAIKSCMESGALARCHRDILSLTYLNDDESTILSSNVTNTVGNSNTFPLIVSFVLLGLLTSILVAIYLLKSRHHRQSKRDASSNKTLHAINSYDGIDIIANNYTAGSSKSSGLLETDWVDFQSGQYFNSGIIHDSNPIKLSSTNPLKDEYDARELFITQINRNSNGRMC